jgi:hypothetical protein
MEVSMSLDQFVINPFTLALLIACLVQFCKELGLRPAALRWLSVGLGFALAVLFKLREVYPAAAGWIEIVFFGLAAGFGAPGAYSLVDERLPKWLGRADER